MKKLFTLLLAVIMVLSLVACGSKPEEVSNDQPATSSTDAVFNLKCSTFLNDSSALMPLMKDYVAKIAERTDNHVVITIYPGEQLGGYETTFEETMRGTIEFGINSVPGSYDHRLECVHVPGSLTSFDDLESWLQPDGAAAKNYAAAMDELNLHFLGFFSDGFTNIGFKEMPDEGFNDPSAAKKELIRVPSSSDYMIKAVQALGFTTAGLPGSDVYSSLQTGIINGTTGLSNSRLMTDYPDVTSFIYNCKLDISGNPIFINKAVWESIPAEYQQIIEDCTKELLDANMAFLREQDLSLGDQLAAAGIEVYNPTAEEFAAIREIFISEVWPSLDERYGKDFMDAVRASLGN